MRKRFGIASIVAFIGILAIALPALASFDVSGAYYNFNATYNSNDYALIVYWSDHPQTGFRGTDFTLKGSERTLGDIEARIQKSIDDMTITKENINQLPSDDPARQNPPVLFPWQKLVGNQLYTYSIYFRIHIYSIDDPATPQSELRFITIFEPPLYFPPPPDDWWVGIG